MANYVKATDFASKDGLLTGDPLKIVSGTEIDDEYNAIQTAINSKANTNSPAFTGNPTAPTATAGTNTTQLATTAFVTGANTTQTNTITTAYEAADTTLQNNIDLKANIASPVFTGNPRAPTPTAGDNDTSLATTAFVTGAVSTVESSLTTALRALYPVGTIYTNATNGTNPATLLGFGTWVGFGPGRVPVGFDASNPLFNALEKTGGSADAVVVSHNHTASTASAGNHRHYFLDDESNVELNNSTRSGNFQGGFAGGQNLRGVNQVQAAGAHTHTVTVNNTGESGTNKNYQPYITVYMWKRTA